ncbi:MAG: chromosome segregation protein SMC [Bacteroidetes bacterium]|nr:chromosome segregation protein SMC [Bacteroidota bacterium]
MYLSKLEIVGFKSFANKVNLSFDVGMTAIVGPNGCGKTNVVDAIRWALGEQKPSRLRSDKMEDVIFNGTKNRKPLGMADVSLTIENTKGILPSEYKEVVITRRVYRSGESEYYLNKTLCRLKDIKDLFMDTGMGSDAYSVIELKMIETILSDKADERRRLFEEAAGVTKYKVRRKETFTKLDHVQADLVRVQDIVKEVQKAVNSLERQANKAEQFNLISAELRTKEIILLEREYAEIVLSIDPLKEKLLTAVDEKKKISDELSSEEVLLDTLREELTTLEERLNEVQIELNEHQQRINLSQQARVKANERTISLNESIDRFLKEKEELQQQLPELETRAAELKSGIEKTHADVIASTAQYTEKKEELDTFTAELEKKKSDVKAKQDEVIALLHEISSKRNEYERIKARLENINGRLEYSGEENTLYNEEITKNSATVAELTAQDRELRKQFAEAELAALNEEAKKVTLQEEIESLRDNEYDLRSAADRKRSRLEFLKGLVESHEGFSEGAKYLMAHDEWKDVLQTTVADAFSSDAKYRIAIEAALGDVAGYIVVNTIDDAHRGVELLKENNKGRATFVCLESIPQTPDDAKLDIIESGVIAWANDTVQCDARYAGLRDFLLAGTIIVEDVQTAANLVRKYFSLKCVTLDGELVTGSGILRGGSNRAEDGGMLGKKAQIEELEREIAALAEQRDAVRKQSAEKERMLSAVDVKSRTEAAKKIEQQMTSVEMRIAQIEYEKKRMAENVQRNDAENSRLKEEANALANELKGLQPSITALEERKSAADQQSGASASELETMEVMWNEFSKVATDAQLEMMRLENEEKNFARELEYINATMQNIRNTFAQRDVDIENSNREIVRLQETLLTNAGELEELDTQLKEIVERKRVAQTDFNAKRTQSHEIELKLKDARRLHDSSLSRSHELEMRISELTMRTQNLLTRAKEEFDYPLEVKEFPAEPPFDIEAAREEIREMKDKIRSLGAVNFAAFDEYKTEKERMDFITVQRDDLIESEKTLLQTIEEINNTAQKEFLTTFEKIRENFITTFKGLFDEGDECDLRLEEGVDPLEARIEITAKPRGKRPTSIDLLSGGEKTLTAIALLFAIYLVKPSPFCILDEVDAPLDDSNIDRFARIIRKFSDNTQFIIVTHNKRTMEAANAMYGVTMEEQGVSKLVSVRFNENKVATN